MISCVEGAAGWATFIVNVLPPSVPSRLIKEPGTLLLQYDC